MLLQSASLSVRPSLLDERRTGLVAESVGLDGAVGLPLRPVVELKRHDALCE